jgi:amino acid adenylation domain-containing protein
LIRRPAYQLGDERANIMCTTTFCPTSQHCLNTRFEAQVARTPDAVAVCYRGEALTYRQLNLRANQLAHFLRKRGAGPEVLVAIYMDRGLDMVVAIVAILKAGAGYVPLDCTYPSDRLAFMLDDSQPALVVTQGNMRLGIPRCASDVVCVDTERDAIASESTQNPVSKLNCDNLAYVIYTSGSTGKPKGVLITHHNVVRLFEATWPWYQFDEHDVWTMFHSYAFDFSVWELWGALIHGGRLVVVPYMVSRSPVEFYELLQRERVTILNQTPSSFQQLMRADEVAGGVHQLALRYVIFGGEELQMSSLRPWFARHGDQNPRLVNMYGITETTVHVTYRPLSMADTAGGSIIGRAIPDLQIYLLDSQLQLVPVSVPGEIFVGGAGVGRGYLRRPELTKQRFIDNPFNGKSESKLYRSGDLARLLPNGDLEYLGRIDTQVKIRGYRVELNEVVAVLNTHPAVQASAVVARADGSGNLRLLAYVVIGQGQAPPDAGELRTLLHAQLPDYMMPAVFLQVRDLPLTSNGKLDRDALPGPEDSNTLPNENYVSPQTMVEEQLSLMVAELLGLNRVGIKDNFFLIGGHSLFGAQLIARIRDTFGVDLPLSSIFEWPTPGQLAQRIETHMVTKSKAMIGDNAQNPLLQANSVGVEK